MIVLKLILFMLFITVSQCRIPDKVYCANKECDGPISKAKTLLLYNSPDPDLISFSPNKEAVVYMKSADATNPDLWYVTINGKSGFALSKFLRESKIIVKNPPEIVPFIRKEANVQPDKVQKAHEVFEGTTIYTTEAAANVAQQDSSTEASITSNNDGHTPSLTSVTETPTQNKDNTILNVPSQDSQSVSESQSADIKSNNEKQPSTISPELPVQEEFNESEEIEIISESDDDDADVVVKTDQIPIKVQQVDQELPKEVSSEVPTPQQIISTGSGPLNTDGIEVPEKQDFLQNTLNDSKQTESKDQNTSTHNNNAENVPISQDSSIETNNKPNGNSLNETETRNEPIDNPNGEPLQTLTTNPVNSVTTKPILPSVNPSNEPVVPPINEPAVPPAGEPIVPPVNEPTVPPLTESIVPPVTESTVPPVIEPTVSPVREPSVPPKSEPIVPPVVPPLNEPIIDPIQQLIPPIYVNLDAGNQYGQNAQVDIVEAKENSAIQSEAVPSPIHKTLPTAVPVPAPSTQPVSMDPVTTTTETIPAFYPGDAQTTLPPETIPPIIKMEIPTTTEIPSQEVPPLFTYTTPVPYNSDESSIQYETTESVPTEATDLPPDTPVEDIIAALPDPPEDTSSSTEDPAPEKSEGFFSNMYSTVADIWPSSSEAPEPLYNTEYPTYESEKAEEGFSFMKYLKSTYYSVMGTSEESKALFASVGETCFSDEYCDGVSGDGSNRLLTFLLTTASSVLLFTLGYYYIDNRRQDGRLIGTINSLQRDLLFTTKECEILKEELSSTKNKLAGIEDSSFGMDDMVQSLKEEINELKATNERLRNSLDDNEKLLRVSENTAGELQNTLSEVENTLSELLAERANSEEQIIELNGKIQAFEEELISVSRDRDNFQLKYVSAETALEEFKKQKKQLEEVNQQLAEAKNTIELQKHEIEALKEAIKDLKSGMSSDLDVTSFLDHTEIKAKLSKALQEKKSYESKYETEHKERARLAEELKAAQETLSITNQNATEALTRLEVLGKYFQEREGELLKELSAKESLWLSKQGESASTVEKIELLQQEVQRYKEKCDALTLELAEQESSRRSALSEVETRAHAAWLDARAARRDADAARDDAAALRRKLASLTSADGAVSPHHKVSSPLESVEPGVIPPPLPPMFLPPPLLPPLPRPPPLGRLPSPHPPRYGDRRYSPDSRYSPESRYSPDSRYSPETVRYSPDSRYSPRSRRSAYSPRSRRRSRSRERYEENRVTRSRNGPAPPDTETEYNSDSPSRQPRRRGRYSRRSGPSSGSGCSSESDK